MTDKPTEPSLADLCAPLSAKVMPRSAMADRSSRMGSDKQLLMAQRKTRRHPRGGATTTKGARDGA